MKISSLLLISLITLSCQSGDKAGSQLEKTWQSMNTGKELAKVGDTSINDGFLGTLKLVNPRIEAQIKNPFMRKKIIDNLVEQELLLQESLKQGLDKSDEILQKQVLYRRVVIAQTLLEKEIEKEAKANYEKNKDAEFTRVDVSHILVAFEKDAKAKTVSDAAKKQALDKAKKIKARLDKGEDFAKVAADASDDKISKRKGGSLGAVSKSDKRLARRGYQSVTAEAFKLAKDKVSEPIESKKGYHLIKVTSDPTVTPFEEAERTIRFQIQKDVRQKLIDRLKEKTKVAYAKDEKAKTDAAKPQAPKAPQQPTGHEGHAH